MKPRVFIGSSAEKVDLAERLQKRLQYVADVTIWSQGLFTLSESTLDQLLQAIRKFDFAIFVFATDDDLTIRAQSLRAVRDNVVFELGLFMGRLGKNSTFILAPKASDMQWLSDLAGFTPARYDAKRYESAPDAALGPPGLEISDAIKANFTPLPGVYVMGTHNRLGVGWRTYADFEGAMDVYTSDAHLHGGAKGGVRYPWTDNAENPRYGTTAQVSARQASDVGLSDFGVQICERQLPCRSRRHSTGDGDR